MNPHLQRAMLLFEQSRYEMAEQELHQALGEQPDDAMVHAVYALCLARQNQYDRAMSEVQLARGLNPELPFVFYAQSLVLSEGNRFAEAMDAIQQAIGLNPYQTHFFAQLARLQLEQRRWQGALEAAEQGLALDPEDVDCTNLRAIALARLGRRVEAGQAIETALKRDPEDATSHANMGWSMLESGQVEKAMEHFREALRLDPESDWARRGIVEAMKARYLVYRVVLGWFVWMMRLSAQAQWGVLIGAYVGYQVLRSVARNNPALAPWLMPVLIAYVAFAIMTWVASPLLNLMLRLNRFGRLALTREQIVTSNWVGLCVLGAIFSLVAYFALGNSDYLFCAIAWGLVIPPLSHIYSCSHGWPRVAMIVITTALAGLAAVINTSLPISSHVEKNIAQILSVIGHSAFLVFIVGAIAAQFAVNALIQVRPRHGGISTNKAWLIGGLLLMVGACLFLAYSGLVTLAVLAQPAG